MRLSPLQPIGIFDSGIGGLTIAREIISKLPHEDVIYFGDTAHMPYGDKSEELIKFYSRRITEFLISRGCKIVVIACNTASSIAYHDLVERFGEHVSIINVVSPIVKGVAENVWSKEVGIIGTKGTIRSKIYEKELKALRPDMVVHSLETPLLAPMIEAGFYDDSISAQIIASYLSDPILSNISSLILACTHYPLIKKEIETFYTGKEVKVFDSTDFVADEVRKILGLQGLLNDRKRTENHFFASDLTESFAKTTKIFFKENLHLEFCPLWDS
ncbi:MAG: glutamate racemase [Chitinophagales bacterium]|nr:glutamate racemase [Chitinophagales bacterium]